MASRSLKLTLALEAKVDELGNEVDVPNQDAVVAEASALQKEDDGSASPTTPAPPRIPPDSSRLFYYLHIHKAGGSSMCGMAKLVCMTSLYMCNCH